MVICLTGDCNFRVVKLFYMFKRSTFINKISFIIPALLFVACTIREVCVDCSSIAIILTVRDADSHQQLQHATITVFNTRLDTTTYCDTCKALRDNPDGDSTCHVAGIPATYTIQFSHPEYASFEITGIEVSQWDEVTCPHANTKNLIVEVKRAAPAKTLTGSSFTIADQFENGHCR